MHNAALMITAASISAGKQYESLCINSMDIGSMSIVQWALAAVNRFEGLFNLRLCITKSCTSGNVAMRLFTLNG